MKDATAEIMGYLLFLLCFVVAVFVTSCSTQVAPNLKFPELKPPAQACTKLDIPPIPQDVKLDIFGKKIEANAGGRTVLVGYVQCQKLMEAR